MRNPDFEMFLARQKLQERMKELVELKSQELALRKRGLLKAKPDTPESVTRQPKMI